jgi:hypothetical protein
MTTETQSSSVPYQHEPRGGVSKHAATAIPDHCHEGQDSEGCTPLGQQHLVDEGKPLQQLFRGMGLIFNAAFSFTLLNFLSGTTIVYPSSILLLCGWMYGLLTGCIWLQGPLLSM